MAAIVIRQASDKQLPSGLEDAHFIQNYLGQASLFGDLVTASIASQAAAQVPSEIESGAIEGPGAFFFNNATSER